MDARVTELHCIMPIANIASVLTHGILSNERASGLAHTSIAMSEIQDRRKDKQISGGMRLHQYANLYFHARNPMLYVRKHLADETCILRVSTDVLRIDGVVIADQNASSDWVLFLEPSQWQRLAWDDIYSPDWSNRGDKIDYWRRKSRKCAEVLVPHCVESKHLIGAYVVDVAAQGKLEAAGFRLPVTIDGNMFFR